jgi:hypothetical protein
VVERSVGKAVAWSALNHRKILFLYRTVGREQNHFLLMTRGFVIKGHLPNSLENPPGYGL